MIHRARSGSIQSPDLRRTSCFCKTKLSPVFSGWFIPVGWWQPIHVCIWSEIRGVFLILSPPSPPPDSSVWPFISHPPRLLLTSTTAAYDWSSSTDLHLWFKCQESSPILKCTVVIRLSDSLVWSQEQTVCPPSPTQRTVRGWVVAVVVWQSFFFQSGHCVPKPWNSPLCGMTKMCNFILHLEDWLFTMCVKYFWKTWCSWILYLLCNFCRLRIHQSLYCCTYNQKPNISMKTVRRSIYINIYNLFWDLFFMLVLAALVGGVNCAEMQNVCRLCYTLTVKCSFSMLCTDFKISNFYLFREPTIALLNMYW